MNTTFFAPETLDDALRHLDRSPQPVVLAGGTDLWPQWNGVAPHETSVLSLHRLKELSHIERAGSDLVLGALCTHRALGQDPLIRAHAPSLGAAAETIGALQIQNRGTLGGNIINGSPAADLPPALLAGRAILCLASTSGRREVPIDAFYRGYRDVDRRQNELLLSVRLPILKDGEQAFFQKVGTRKAQAISKVVGAARINLSADGTIAEAAIAFGSVAATSLRLSELEAWLMGQRPAEAATQSADRAAACITPMDDLRSSADYRRHVVGQLVQRWIEACGAKL